MNVNAARIQEIQSLFVNKLTQAQDWLGNEGIEYRTLGSVATSAYLGNEGLCWLDFNRGGARGKYQRMPDIDIVVPMKDYLRVKAYRDMLERDAEFPIGIEILPSVCHFDFRPDEVTSFITHKDLFTPFPTRLFSPVEIEFLGEPLITVDPRTLFHTYVTLGGMLRPKDWPQALQLARLIRDNSISQFSEVELRPFHDFLAERSRRYPGYRRYRILANWARYRVPNWLHYGAVYYGRKLQPVFFGTKGRPK